ncbi:MAG: hypothetical protein JWM98_2629 [Thermoleophilia bacterium]|nr:hypothetical protein [Thermoleophilia bacterium]
MEPDRNVLHVTYGDALAEGLRATAPDADVLVVREALRDGPLSPSPNEDPAAFIAVRARHLAAAHGADETEARAELTAAWERIAAHDGDVVLHVDAEPCIDCATFVACALEAMHRAGRAVARGRTGVAIVRGDADAVELTPAAVAAGAGAWRLLVAGDDAGLTLTATDLEGQGGMGGYPELPGLLVRRAQGDVPLAEVHP